jgi:hypothetical protein
MSKAIFGVVTVLALAMSQAWAGDEKAGDEAASKTTVAKAETKSESVTVSGSGSEAGRDNATMKESAEVRAALAEEQERWIREREGYRDGGY